MTNHGIRTRPWRRRRSAEAGFSIIEAIVATIIATVAGIGIAYSFSTGRALVDRYDTARVALGAAQARMESIRSAAPGSSLRAPGEHGPVPVVLDGDARASERWSITLFDDVRPGYGDVYQLTVTVSWGDGLEAETVTLRSLLAGL